MSDPVVISATPPTTIPNDMVFALKDIEVPHFTISDLGSDFSYQSVRQPDGEESGYYALSYRKSTAPKWLTLKGLLSKQFRIAKTSSVVNKLINDINGNVLSRKDSTIGTVARTQFVLSGFECDLHLVDIEEQIMFSLVTGLNVNIESIKTTQLAFIITNGYAGDNALTLSFGINRKYQIGSDTHETTNIFLLDGFRKRLIHDSRLQFRMQDITEVQSSIQNQINLFKQIAFTHSDFEEINSHFIKRQKSVFQSMFSGVNVAHHNLFFITFILSSIITSNNAKMYALESTVREFIAKKILNHQRVSS